ncbi:MAG: hypothetical protein NDI75_15040 [Candidatus Didemnitutus sp.]|nr:hypothetical protein [Candidatus Didemnitutus sp.]
MNIQDIAAAVVASSSVTCGILWVLNGRYATKEELQVVRQRADECHTKHDLTAQPIDTLTKAVDELKNVVERFSNEASVRHEAMMKQLGELHTRTTVLEEIAPRGRKR